MLVEGISKFVVAEFVRIRTHWQFPEVLRLRLRQVLCRRSMFGWPGLEGAARNPGASFASLSPAPATPAANSLRPPLWAGLLTAHGQSPVIRGAVRRPPHNRRMGKLKMDKAPMLICRLGSGRRPGVSRTCDIGRRRGRLGPDRLVRRLATGVHAFPLAGTAAGMQRGTATGSHDQQKPGVSFHAFDRSCS